VGVLWGRARNHGSRECNEWKMSQCNGWT
jgi:hypothetical protein